MTSYIAVNYRNT